MSRTPNIDGMYNLKVDGITQRTTVDDLREAFQRFGEIGDIYIPREYGSNRLRGFAFVRFKSQEEGEMAQRQMDGQTIDGNIVSIQVARERRPDNPREAMKEKGGRFERRGRHHDRYDRDVPDAYDRRGGDDYGYDRGYGGDRHFERDRERRDSRDRYDRRSRDRADYRGYDDRREYSDRRTRSSSRDRYRY